MERRKALKNIGLGVGLTALTPSLISMFQSCQKVAEGPKVALQFFTQEEFAMITQLTDVMLPKTDSPSGTEVHVHTFIDKYIAEVYNQKSQETVRDNLDAFKEVLLKEFSKNSLKDIDASHLIKVLDKYLRIGGQQEKTYRDEMKETSSASVEAKAFAFLENYRNQATRSYKISEFVGEEVLAYDPIPGHQQGCVSLHETTAGMAWSL